MKKPSIGAVSVASDNKNMALPLADGNAYNRLQEAMNMTSAADERARNAEMSRQMNGMTLK